MPNGTADPARIRLIRREHVFARFANAAILASHPNARDGFEEVRESFFTDEADAQGLLNELAANIATPGPRRHEAAEAAVPLKFGDVIPLTPAVPRARMVDRLSALDRVMIIKGVSIDFHTVRNSIETVG